MHAILQGFVCRTLANVAYFLLNAELAPCQHAKQCVMIVIWLARTATANHRGYDRS